MKRSELVELLNAMPDVPILISDPELGWCEILRVETCPENDHIHLFDWVDVPDHTVN